MRRGIKSRFCLVSFALISTCFSFSSEATQTPWSFLHSHNDYQQKRPLLDALDQGFESVEADIWLTGDLISISHLGFIHVGTLKDLYLDPLQERVRKNGSVYGDGRPFHLWLDIKDGNPDLVEKLHSLLEEYPMFTVFTDTETKQGPVTAILTGNARSKNLYVDRFRVRKACRDEENFQISDPDADRRWLWYSLKWSDLFKWGGYSSMKPIEKQKLVALVNYIHQKGKKIRFWDAPENDSFWSVAAEAGVDMIGADAIQRLSVFSKSKRQILK